MLVIMALLGIIFCSGVFHHVTYNQNIIQTNPPTISVVRRTVEHMPRIKPTSHNMTAVTLLQNLGLGYPFEGELSTYQELNTFSLMLKAGVNITDVQFSDTGDIYILGNYKTASLDFSTTGYETVGTPVSFSTGTPSVQSSFIVVFDRNYSFKYGTVLDFDDRFDYKTVSMKISGTNLYVAAENQTVGNPSTKQYKNDITVFKYSTGLSYVSAITFGGSAQEVLGGPTTNGLTQNAEIMDVDASGNVYITGVTHSNDFYNNGTNIFNTTTYSTTETFESFGVGTDHATNVAITTQVDGLTFADWASANATYSGGLVASSGTQVIFPGVNMTIVFNEPTSYVKYFTSVITGDNNKTASFYDDNSNLITKINATSGSHYAEYTTQNTAIKYMNFVLGGPKVYDFSVDDFQFIKPKDTSAVFVTKLDSNLNIVSQWADPAYNKTAQVTTTSIAVGSSGSYIAGSTNSNFTQMGLSSYQNKYFSNQGTGFITSLDTNFKVSVVSTLGGVNSSEIYDLELNDTASKLYAAGKSMSDTLILNPNILLDALQPSNGSGFIAQFTPGDLNLLYFHKFGDNLIKSDGSAVTDIELQNNFVYYTGEFNFTAWNTYSFSHTGPFSTNTTYAFNNPNDQLLYYGILNSTLKVSYQSLQANETNAITSLAVDPQTGDMLIPFFHNGDLGSAITMTGLTYQDTDQDGLSNYNEINVFFSSPTSADTDNDTLPDAAEVYIYFTDPNKSDTDGDCLPDAWEVAHIGNGFNPLLFDSNSDIDNDGLTAQQEYLAGTDFNNSDTDGDGLTDGQEVAIYHTNPLVADGDVDGLSDKYELTTSHTNPNLNDTDGDGLIDGNEVLNQITICDGTNCSSGYTNPLKADTDNDGLSDKVEIMQSITLPWSADTDGDGISDYLEFYQFNTSSWLLDSDTDGLNDSYELFFTHTNPNKADSDSDGLSDKAEITTYGTNPNSNDTDQDGLTDYFEIFVSNTSALLTDADHDGLNDKVEYYYGSNSTNPDSDGDHLPDAWEFKYGLNSSLNETYLDFDNDGMNNLMEYLNGTNPVLNDTDSDGLLDGAELTIYHTNPLNPDTDADTLADGQEVKIYHTNPLLNDTDSDGLPDAFEILVTHSNATLKDTDGDGISDYAEYMNNTSLTSSDTDGDGITDGQEISVYHTNPLLNDTDSDGLLDGFEVSIDYDPTVADMDQDGLSDGYEYNHNYNAFVADMDNDTLLDGAEVNTYHTNPLSNDTDADTLLDGEEVLVYGTNPNSNDTDYDQMPDAYELANNLNPLVFDALNDSDHDGLTNYQEYKIGTDPHNKDTDGDGYTDFQEISQGTNPLVPDPTQDQSFGEKAANNPALMAAAVVSFLLSIMVMFRGRTSFR